MPRLADCDRTTTPMKPRRSELMILGAAMIGQQVIVAPTGHVPSGVRLRMPTREDHCVDGRTAADKTATGEPNAPAIEHGLWRGVLIPTQTVGIANPRPHANQRQVQDLTIWPTGLQQGNGVAGAGESRRDNAARRAGADHDEVERIRVLLIGGHERDNTRAPRLAPSRCCLDPGRPNFTHAYR